MVHRAKFQNAKKGFSSLKEMETFRFQEHEVTQSLQKPKKGVSRLFEE